MAPLLFRRCLFANFITGFFWHGFFRANDLSGDPDGQGRVYHRRAGHAAPADQHVFVDATQGLDVNPSKDDRDKNNQPS